MYFLPKTDACLTPPSSYPKCEVLRTRQLLWFSPSSCLLFGRGQPCLSVVLCRLDRGGLLDQSGYGDGPWRHSLGHRRQRVTHPPLQGSPSLRCLGPSKLGFVPNVPRSQQCVASISRCVRVRSPRQSTGDLAGCEQLVEHPPSIVTDLRGQHQWVDCRGRHPHPGQLIDGGRQLIKTAVT